MPQHSKQHQATAPTPPQSSKWDQSGAGQHSTNISLLLDQLLLGYDSHVRPNFGGKWTSFSLYSSLASRREANLKARPSFAIKTATRTRALCHALDNWPIYCNLVAQQQQAQALSPICPTTTHDDNDQMIIPFICICKLNLQNVAAQKQIGKPIWKEAIVATSEEGAENALPVLKGKENAK